MRGGAVVLVLVLLGGCAHRVECTVHGGPVWREIRTQHFSTLTDLPLEQAHQEALDLEEVRLAVRWYFQLPGDGDDFTEVVFLSSEEELAETKEAGGYAVIRDPPEAGFLVTTWHAPKYWLKDTTIPHELAHRFSAEVYPVSAPWLEEGIASYLESAKLDGPAHAWVGEVGDRWYSDAPLHSLQELWAIPSFADLTGAVQLRAYASAWAWVHYLANHEQARWAAFGEQRRKGVPERAAFEALFPQREWAALEQAVNAYLYSAHFDHSRLTFTYERRILSEAEAPPWRVHMVRRLLEVHGAVHPEPERITRAQAETELARSLAPTPLPWLVADALATNAGAHHLVAQANPGEYMAELLLAKEALDEKLFALAEQHARAALAVRPNGPTALKQLGLAALYQNRIAEAEPLLVRAQHLAPWSPDASVAMARLSAAQGKCGEVTRWLRNGRLHADPSPESSRLWDEFEKKTLASCRPPT